MDYSRVRLLALLLGVCPVACGDDGGGSGDTDASTGEETDATTSDSPTTSSTTTTASTSSTTTTTSSSSSTTTSTTTAETGDEESSGPTEPTEFDDEFDDPATLSSWTRLHEVEGDPAPYEVLDINDTTAGQLTVVPLAGGWFGDFDGTFLFKMVSGDFVVELEVSANRRGEDGGPPQQLYNSAGLFMRDPASGDGSESWVMHNVGQQSIEVGVATEGKTTRNSQSQLELIPGTWSGRLRLCRVGSQIVLARQLSDENAWTETHSYDRPDMPDDVQLGMVVNGWNSNGGMPDLQMTPDINATFEYVRLRRPGAIGDCTAN